MTPRLVLASASPARRRLLQRAGVDPEVHVSDIDEDALIARLARERELSVAEQAQILADAKADHIARSVIAEHADETIIIVGCDTILELDGRAHNKPADAQQARERWSQMSGRTGILHTGHAVLLHHPGRDVQRRAHVATALVHFGSPSPAEIEDYIASGEPLRVAGAFTLEGLGGAFIDSIEGTPSAIEGLSLPGLRHILGELGITWTMLWQRPEDSAE